MAAAAARERNERQYEDGGGYGKFRKRPFRRSTQTTPYDRPATAIRNPRENSNGWLSKLMDPAQRLIASGAHRLFASVFRKRLPAPPLVPPPSQPPETVRETEANRGAMDKQKGTFSTDHFETHGAAVNGCSSPSNSSDTGGVTDLEVILKQKTFTRSEIDRLTALLQSRTVDFPTGNEEKKSEVIPSRAMISEGKKELLTTPVNNGFESRFNLTPIVGSSVVDEDVGSPTELAKAYMRSRPSKVSPSMLESRSQVIRENSTALVNHTFTPKSPMMSIAPRSSGRAGFPENGFVTPRPRGRSAIYSMARTPYSRVHATTGLQGTGTASDAFAGPSSLSQNTWENNRFSGSKQGALKRRSSVLDNDIGSGGPIRRIRQKSNLLPMSGTLSIRGTGIGSNVAQKLSSTEKPVLVGEPSNDNGNNNVHGAGFTPVPSKSSEMASKILQQLDVLVSSREKSPAKLSPSMLRGPALRSLEDVDSSKLLEIVNHNNKLDAKHNALLPDARVSVLKKQDKIEENGPSKPIVPYDKSASAVNGMDPTSSMKNDVAGVKTTAFTVMSTTTQSPLQKKRAFQMSAPEDFLELDDNDYSNGTATGTLAEGREKVDTKLVEKKTIGAEAVVVEKSPACSEMFSPSTSTLNPKGAGMDGSVVAEKSIGFASPAVPLPAITDKQAVVDNLASISDEAALPKDSNASPRIFSSEEKVALPKEPNGISQTFHFSNKTGGKVAPFAFSSQVMSDPSGPKLGLSSDAKSEGFSFTPVATRATELVIRATGSDKADDKNSLKTGDSFREPENVSSTSTSSTGSVFSFGITSNSSNLNNGSLASTPSSYSSPSLPLLSSNITGQNSSSISASSIDSSNTNASTTTFGTANTNGKSNFSISAPAPSLTATPIFKLGSVPSTSTSTIPSTTDETTEAKTKEPSFGNPTTSPLGGTSSAITSTAGSIFGGTSSGITNAGHNIFGEITAVASKENSVFGGRFPAVTSTGSSILNATSCAVTSTGSGPFSFNTGSTTSAATNQSQAFNPFSAGSTLTAAGTGLATSTQSMPMQFSSLASTPFASTGSAAFPSGSPTFGSSSTSQLFNSGATFGLNSSSESISVSSIASPASTVFASDWQAPKSTGFPTSSSSSSTLFAFGATSNAVTSSSASMGFSPSVSSGPLSPFSSPASATPSQPVFGNPSSAFRFGSSPSGNNDHMSMEDSMAEDTVQATTPSVNVFSQPLPTPGPIFGFSTPPGGNQFASAGPSGANPFQFGSQSNLAVPQNPSFQASGSLEFNAGGSFSLGAGGGDKSGRKRVRVKKTQRKR